MNRGANTALQNIRALFRKTTWIIDEVLDNIPGSNIRLISNGNLMTKALLIG